MGKHSEVNKTLLEKYLMVKRTPLKGKLLHSQKTELSHLINERSHHRKKWILHPSVENLQCWRAARNKVTYSICKWKRERLINLSNEIEQSLNVGSFKKKGVTYLELRMLGNPETKMHTLFTPVQSVFNRQMTSHYQKLFEARSFIE